MTLSSEDSIAHVIWDVIAHIFDPIFDPIPEIVIEAPDIVETIGAWDIVSGITKEVIVHVGVEIILEVILGRETRKLWRIWAWVNWIRAWKASRP